MGIVGFVLEYEQLADATTWNDRLAITAVGVAMALAGNVAEEVFEGSHSRRDSSTGGVGVGASGRRSFIARHRQDRYQKRHHEREEHHDHEQSEDPSHHSYPDRPARLSKARAYQSADRSSF